MKKFVKILILTFAWLPILPAQAYIDPATGSMLFSVVLGVLTTLVFLFHSLLFKLKLLFNKKMLSKEKLPFVIYSEGKQYWSVFHGILDEFEKRKIYYDKYQEILADECPMIYLYSPLRLIAVRNRVGNVYPTILGGMVHNTSELYIK